MVILNRRTMTLLLLLVLFCRFAPASSQQNEHPSEPFAAVDKDELAAASNEQTGRLQNLRDLPTTQSLYVVRLKGDVSSIGDRLRLPVLNHKSLVLSKTGGDTHDPKNFTWIGAVEGQQHGTATLVIRDGKVTGSIASPQGLYRINSLGDGLYAIVGVDTRKMPAEEPPNRDSKKQ